MPQYWYIVEALVVLAKTMRHRERTFTRADLIAWSEKFAERRKAAQIALDHLAASGLARRIPRPDDAPPAKPGTWTYVLTPEGMAAAKAAYDAWKHAARSAGCVKGNHSRPRARDSFAQRLWTLLRMRQAITAPEAAETLVDAGADVATATATASRYLRLWGMAHPDAIQISKKLGARGVRRIVLVRDLGPDAPVTTVTPQKAQGGAAA